MSTQDGPVHSVTLGEAEKAALLLHCSLGRHQMLIPLAKALGDHKATLMDLLGHGRSERVNNSSRLVDNAAAAADLFTGPGLVIGHSYGGVAALRFALDHPDRVTGLVLLEPVLIAAAQGTDAHKENLERFGPVIAGFNAGDDEAAARAFLDIWGDGTPWEALPEPARAYLSGRIFVVEDTRDELESDSTGILEPGVLEGLKCPVLLIRGDQSPAVLAEVQASLAAKFPNASEVVLSGEGHMFPVQKPALVAEKIKDWLAKH